jgi:hypothetical protein
MREIEVLNKANGNIRVRTPDRFNLVGEVEYAFCKYGGSRNTIRKETIYRRNINDKYWTTI